MPFMLKIRWDIKEGQQADFKANQEKLCEVMLEHPGVIAYHAEYPSPGLSEWTEIYATDAAFKAHLTTRKARRRSARLSKPATRSPVSVLVTPTTSPKEILAGFGTTYPETAPQAFVLNPRADKDLLV